MKKLIKKDVALEVDDKNFRDILYDALYGDLDKKINDDMAILYCFVADMLEEYHKKRIKPRRVSKDFKVNLLTCAASGRKVNIIEVYFDLYPFNEHE
jgi:hypothetical protein